jgi:hypothetical protein
MSELGSLADLKATMVHVGSALESGHRAADELRDGGKSIGRMAWGQYGNRVGIPSILKLLAKHSVPAQTDRQPLH